MLRFTWRDIWNDRKVFMIYLEGYVSLQKGYMGRYEDVYDIYEGHMAR